MQLQSLVERAVKRTLGARRGSPRPSHLREPPQLSGGMPLLGHTIDFVRSPINLLRRAQAECGEIASVTIAGMRMVALFGPEAQRAVFRAPDEQLNPAEAYKFMTPIFGEGVVYDAEMEKMGEQLKMLLPALQDRRMRTYGETIVTEVEQAIAGWGDKGTVDIVDFCRVLTNFTSSHCLMGPEFRQGMTTEFASLYHDLELGITPIAYLNAHLPLPAFRRRDRARARLAELVTGIVAERRRMGRVGQDFLQTLMEARYAGGQALNEHEITGLLVAAMFAGHHTSSVTTAWTLLELLKRPDYMARVVGQMDEVFAGGAAIDFQTLRELPLAEYAIKETLRLHPPLIMLIRVVKQDFVFKDYFIPKGTWILVSPAVAHLIESVFADCERFDPDRFAPPRVEDKRDFAYIPFGGGRHKCLGNAFAILQIKTIMAILLQRYEFELYGDPIAPNFKGMVVGPKEPCRLVYRRRKAPAAMKAPPTAKAAPATQQQQEPEAPAPAAPPPATGCPVHHEQAPHAAPAARRLTIALDRDLCQGHAVCLGEAPEVFELGADNKVQLRTQSPAPELHDKVRRAAAFCPTGTIQVLEE